MGHQYEIDLGTGVLEDAAKVTGNSTALAASSERLACGLLAMLIVELRETNKLLERMAVRSR